MVWMSPAAFTNTTGIPPIDEHELAALGMWA